jgi:SAM-dependent methyltransferase
MRRAARLWFRRLGLLAARLGGFVARAAQRLTYATFTPAEMSALQVKEWEDFGEAGSVSSHRLFEWEEALFARHVRPKDRLLVVGAGTGRDVLPFLEQGHAVTALDIAPRALGALGEAARARGYEVTLLEGSVDEVELPPSAFDAVVFSWFCFGYLRGTQERRAALDRCRASLREGGRILVSYQLRPAPRDISARASALERGLARVLGGAALEAGDEFSMSGTAANPSVFFAHVFAPGQIEEDALSAGLEVVYRDQPAKGVGVLVLTRPARGGAA